MPVTHEADEQLQQRDVVIVPELLANAGAVLASYYEWVQNLQQFPWERETVLRRLESSEKWLAIVLALILGGALGNVWDRVLLGHVVDFVQLYYQRWAYPAFNVADSAITVGAIMLIIDSLFFKRESRSDAGKQ